MKKIIISISTILCVTVCFAQLNVTLSVNPRPSAALSDWSFRKDVLTIIVTNQSPVGTPISAKLKTEIRTTDGTVVATTDIGKVAVSVFSNGSTTVLSAAEVVNLSTLIFKGSYQPKLNRTGKLPAGNYLLVVRYYLPDGIQPLSEERRQPFFLATQQLPVLILPAENAKLNADIAQTAITFRWTALNPAPQTPARYRIQVFEILQNQQAVQALRSNQPLLDKEVVGTTQFVWRPQLDLKTDSLRKFIWSIQCFDDKGEPVASDNGEARSESKTFMIIDKPAADRPGKLINYGL
ncbi:MAG: hypothetical protein JNM14_05850 [Ferruginibacter sp.]|nr:hypothetical protein [Ferruginibacter sp.]